jgi:hypothetical protein
MSVVMGGHASGIALGRPLRVLFRDGWAKSSPGETKKCAS